MHARRPSGSLAVASAPSQTSRKGPKGVSAFVREAADAPTLGWTSHTPRLKPGAAALAFLAAAFTWWIALAAFNSPLMAIAGSLAVAGSLTEAMFPVHHRISDKGASTRCGWQMRVLAWEDVKSARMGTDGIHLSPLRDGSRLGRVRGVTLRFADGNNAEVTSAVRRYLGRDAA